MDLTLLDYTRKKGKDSKFYVMYFVIRKTIKDSEISRNGD